MKLLIALAAVCLVWVPSAFAQSPTVDSAFISLAGEHPVNVVVRESSGSILVGYGSSNSPGGIKRLNGTTGAVIKETLEDGPVTAIVIMSYGNVLAGGKNNFDGNGFIARLDSSLDPIYVFPGGPRLKATAEGGGVRSLALDSSGNIIDGPRRFSLSASFGRSFELADRKNIELRMESQNLTNTVSFTNLGTVVNAINYGLPTNTSNMRSVSGTIRFRF